MENLKIGPLHVTFHRTVRVKEGQISELPPSLGTMKYYLVKEFKATCPESWEENAIFIPLHEKEAMWLDFHNNGVPVAVLVGAGGINALNGQKLGLTLETENYLAVPPQPWLDGWKGEDGTVYQFVATEYKKGEGNTVAEQLIKKESKTGGLGIAVFEAKNPRELEKQARPNEETYLCGGQSFGFSSVAHLCSAAGPSDGYEETCTDFDAEYDDEPCVKSLSATRGRKSKAAEMGVGKGGKIFQKVYPDPYGGPDTWKGEPSAAIAVYLVNAEQFTEITGMPMPPLPKSAQDYIGAWYGLKDEDHGDVSGSEKFTGLKSVFNQVEPAAAKS